MARCRVERQTHCAGVECPNDSSAGRRVEAEQLGGEPQGNGRGVGTYRDHRRRARGTGILNNPVYKGDVVWGRSRWIRSPRDSAIRRCEVVEDADDLVTHHIERLRIVSDDLWN